ncbi:zinc-ribbon domain-containing protein [Bacillus cereus]|nr:zinc-ribbon domain-containing protein [Bacillus cereus]MCQ6348527.1 zinc-ribbon domain-containing protein [Bacillus cereus]
MESKFPEVAKEWSPTKNEGLLPNNVTPKSNKQIWWKCSTCKNEWRATVSSRTSGTSCPECAKDSRIKSFKKYKLKNGSSLAGKFPELIKEWNYKRNGDITPEEVNYGSNEEFWWECELGHEWKAAVKSRTSKGTGCKHCHYELKTSFPEQAIYYYLNKVFEGVINPHKIEADGGKVDVDVFIAEYKIAIEYDGVFYHEKRIRQDEEKNKKLNKLGIEIIRVREKGLAGLRKFNGITLESIPKNRENLNKIVEDVFNYIKQNRILKNEYIDKINDLKIDIEEDEIEINSLFIVSLKKISLELEFPELAKEWHPIKNGKLKPNSVKAKSGKKVWWQCPKCQDEWKAQIYARTINYHKCKWCDPNNLVQTRPDLLKEWDFEKNKEIDFLRMTTRSGKKVWWKCKLGHSYDCTIVNKKNGNGCPYCAGKKVNEENCLAKVKPEIAKQWHPTKNGELTPEDVTIGSHKEVWWYCDKGKAHTHEWKMAIYNKKRGNCPFCSGHKVSLDNCLATKFPQLAEEWDFEKNGSLTPFDIGAYSNKEVWWCTKENGSWKAKVLNRVKVFENK